jgi:lysophospholipase L1-like esterase
LTQLIGTIRGLQRSDGVVVATGYWNVFLDGVVGRRRGTDYVQASDTFTRAVNGVIADAAGRAGARYMDLYQPFKGDGSTDPTPLLAEDGDHPNRAGHRVIADAVLAALGLPAVPPLDLTPRLTLVTSAARWPGSGW